MLRSRNKLFKVVLKWLATFGVLGVTSYPIIIYPMMNSEKYREIQKVSRKDIDRSKIQPGNMKMWSDPFSPK